VGSFVQKDNSCEVWLYLVKWICRRLKCEKVNGCRWTKSDSISSHRHWPGELKKKEKKKYNLPLQTFLLRYDSCIHFAWIKKCESNICLIVALLPFLLLVIKEKLHSYQILKIRKHDIQQQKKTWSILSYT
jgi:hypothetical protein